jgi:flavin reductase (DIM6/NTAB) family NADH-FMN oxidoreductase RutF
MDFLSIRPEELSSKDRYGLLTSLVVPRPIGWISTRAKDGTHNLAPFSFYAALAANPLLVGVSIGTRRGEPKDTMRNVQESGAFGVNVCSEELLEAMNLSSGEYPASVDEFSVAGLEARQGTAVDAPWVAESPAVLECELFKEVGLGDAPNVLLIGEVKLVRLAERVQRFPGSWDVDPETLGAVGRLGKDRYILPREIREMARPG